MAFNVRIFGYRGLVQGIIQIPQQDSKDSLFMLYQPYEFAALAQSNGATPVNIQSPINPSQSDLSKILRVEIPDGQGIRYEINPPGRTTAASTNSPSLTGILQIAWGAGWSMSFIDLATAP
jgi:hypothetical protein